MKRVLLCLLFLLLFTQWASAADTAGAIAEMNIDITMQEDATASVSASLLVHFSGQETEFRIPLPHGAEACTLDYPFTEQTLDGEPFLLVQGGFSQSQSFRLGYTLPCQAAATGDGQTLDLAILSTGFAYPIEKMLLTVHFPTQQDAMPELISGYHGDTAFNDFHIENDGTNFTAQLLTRMQDHDTLRLQLELPTGYFDLRNMPGKTKTVDSYAFLALAAACVLFWMLRLRNGLLLPKRRKILPLDCNAAELGFQISADIPDLTAAVMQWADLGYLYVGMRPGGKLVLEHLMEMGNERHLWERSSFDALFRKGEIAPVRTEQYAVLCKKIVTPIRSYWAHRLFERQSLSVRILRIGGVLASAAVSFMSYDLLLSAFSGRWLVIGLLSVPTALLALWIQQGVICIVRRRRIRAFCMAAASAALLLTLGHIAGNGNYMLPNCLLQVFIGAVCMFGGKRTAVGKDRLLQLLGFRRYLLSADRAELEQALASDNLYFYHILPFAEAMGIGKRFARRFGSIPLESCPWLESGRAKTALDFYERYQSACDFLRREQKRQMFGKRKKKHAVRKKKSK